MSRSQKSNFLSSVMFIEPGILLTYLSSLFLMMPIALITTPITHLAQISISNLTVHTLREFLNYHY